MIRLIYWLFKKSFDRIYYKSQEFGNPMDNMEYKFTDSNGVKYYHFPNLFNMPWPRWEMVQKILLEIEAAMPGKDSKAFREGLLKAFNDSHIKTGKAKDEAIAFGGALFHEWGVREKGIVFQEALFELVAATLIAEGEDPLIWDITKQKEKAVQFEKDAESGLGAFFLQVSISELIPYLKLSDAELTALLKTGEARSQVWRKSIEQFLSGQDGSKKDEPTIN